MPMGLEARCGQILDEVVIVSQRIRRSVLAHANNQNLTVSDRLRGHLEMIRVSADTILEACTRASLTPDTLDDRMIDWLLSGELPLCLSKLKEMDTMLEPIHQTRLLIDAPRPLRRAEDKLSATMVFFDKHKNLFQFLLTPSVWACRNPLHETPQFVTSPIIKDSQYDLQETLDSNNAPTGLDTETEAEYETASEYDYDEYSPLSARVRAMTRKDREKYLHTRQKLDEVSRWLAPLDCTEKHTDTLKQRREGTCRWFPSTDAFGQWRAYGGQFLWLHGKAGCGKSVLIASTIEYLKNTLQKEEVVVFFYCDFRDERSKNSTEVMRSVLFQLIRHVRDCGVDLGDLPNKILERKSEGSLSLNDLDKLGELVSRVASHFRYEPIIVIDALDECADMEALLRAVITLKEADVRLLVTSRPHQIIMGQFRELRSLSIENMVEELAADISLHVEQEIGPCDRLRFASEDMKNEVRAKLTEGAGGRFRWVQCQLNTFNRCSSQPELREALDNLPKGLEATYEIILGAIDERKLEGELARRALTWLVVALEPLRLAQIVDGLSMAPKQQKVDRGWLRGALLHALSSLVSYDEGTDVLALSHFSVKEYLTGGSALPTYQIIPHEAHTEVVQICMRSISVYLKAESSYRNVVPLQSIPVLSYVLSSGFIHLAHVGPESATTLDALQSLGSDVRSHPSHWEHLCEIREELLRWPYPPWPSSRHDFVHYILIAYSSPELLKLFLSLGYPRKPRARTNPLVYAADLRKTEHAMALLGYGADVNMHGLVVDDSRYALPLDIAIDLGEDTLVGEFLQRGCVVTAEVLTTAICMPWCSSRVLVKLMQTDEFVKWSHEIGDEELYRSVFDIARPNGGDTNRTDETHVTMARILQENGLDLSVDSGFGAELVERAIHAAHISMLEFLLPSDRPPPSRFLITASTGDTPETVSVVSFLLRKGVDIHATSEGRKDTALHLAVMCPWEPRRLKLVQLLMEAGCNPIAQNSYGETVLALAIDLRYSSALDLLLSYDVSIPSNILPLALRKRSAPQVVELLIQKGADLHSAFEGKTVLEIVIDHNYPELAELLMSHNVPFPSNILLVALQKRWNLRMIRFLMRKGAELHFTTPDGNSIFHVAVAEYQESDCLNLVQIFVEAGCNPATSSFEGKSVLEVAIEHRYTAVVELLLSHNVPFPPNILSIALRNRSDAHTIRFLIQRSANIHPTMPNGNTIFHLAITTYQESDCLELVRVFIDAGCDPATSNSAGKSVLEVAIEHRYTAVVELLLSYNVPFSPNILSIALWNRLDTRTVRLLVQKGASIHPSMPDGNTIFHLTITEYLESMCLELVKCFVKAGSDLNATNSEGRTVFEAAIERKYFTLAGLVLSYGVPLPNDILPISLQKRLRIPIVEFLIRKGACLYSISPTGNTIYHLAITEYCESDCWDLSRSFLRAGCDPITSNSKGETVLEIAIGHGYTSVVQLLLSYDAPFPSDILPFAVQKCGIPHIIGYLIQKGADIHSMASTGDTVLHVAVTQCPQFTCLNLVEKFIKAGCNPSIRNFEGLTVLETALQRGYDMVVEYLLSCGTACPPDVLPMALQRRSNPWVIESMIRSGADVHIAAPNGETALELVINAGYSELACLALVKILVDAGGDCDVLGRDSDSRKAVLEAAIEHGYTLVVQFLLSCDAHPLSSAVLSKALETQCNPEMIGLLACRCVDEFAVESESRWDTLLQLVHASYTGQDRHSIVRILNATHKENEQHPIPRQETFVEMRGYRTS